MADDAKTTRFMDFDKAFEELEPVKFQLDGKTYELPPEMPITRLFAITQVAQEAGDDQWTKLMIAYVGEDIWNEISDKLGTKRLLMLVNWLNEIYMGGFAVNADAEENSSTDGSVVDPTASTSMSLDSTGV